MRATLESTTSTRYLREPGVPCVLENDRGRWEVVAPGEAAVLVSKGPLRIRCEKTGYAASGLSLECATEAARAKAKRVALFTQVLGTVALAAMLPAPAGVMGPPMPVTPGPAEATGIMAASALAGKAASSAALRGAPASGCTYLPRDGLTEVFVYLQPR